MSEFEGVGGNMDDLFQIGVDSDKVSEVEKSMLLPVDSYVSTPPLTVTPSLSDDGRRVFRVWGAWEGRKTQKVGRFGFAFSPDVRQGRDGGPDRLSKNYAMINRAYVTAFGAQPDTIADLKGYLTEYPVIARLIQVGTQPDAQGEPGNMVVAVSAVRD